MEPLELEAWLGLEKVVGRIGGTGGNCTFNSILDFCLIQARSPNWGTGFEADRKEGRREGGRQGVGYSVPKRKSQKHIYFDEFKQNSGI